MPKQHRPKSLYTKPKSTPPPSLAGPGTSSGENRKDDSEKSVNELVQHLRKTQLSHENSLRKSSVPLAAGSTHPPSVRNILGIPETPPTAPRSVGRLLGRQRRIPGPPPPRSWLTPSKHAPEHPSEIQPLAFSSRIYTSCPLPNGIVPRTRSLQHMLYERIAEGWEWYARNYPAELAELPTCMKETLLSFISASEPNSTDSVRILFPRIQDEDDGKRLDEDADAEVSRLDLSNALGHWTSMKQLARTLLTNNNVETASPGGITDEDMTPESWYLAQPGPVQKTLGSSLRFSNLLHLSLALDPGLSTTAGDWKSLLRVADKLHRLKSLSLAYWEPPSYTPLAASTHVSLRNPLSNSIPAVSYGGSNIYSAMDDDWAEAAGVLTKLSRSLYCLEWFDLSGCCAWLPALTWEYRHSSLAETSGAMRRTNWKSVDSFVLGTGWRPASFDIKGIESVQSLRSGTIDQKYGFPPGKSVEKLRALAISKLPSVHSRAVVGVGFLSEEQLDEERENSYLLKEIDRFMQAWETTRIVAGDLRAIRRQQGGKRIEFDFGEGLISS